MMNSKTMIFRALLGTALEDATRPHDGLKTLTPPTWVGTGILRTTGNIYIAEGYTRDTSNPAERRSPLESELPEGVQNTAPKWGMSRDGRKVVKCMEKRKYNKEVAICN